ncbi:MAG TPA: hypothetical protein PK759_05650 [Spirochaetales bacterium]|nr:hypothetical protein [Spirochaetales bacterium]HPS15266.1 hypothetical protein [Spirochaetales bacterium]
MKRRTFIAMSILAVLLSSCVTAKNIQVPIEKMPMEQARIALIKPFLENTRDFGNNLARIMLNDYTFVSIQQTTNRDYFYRFDRKREDLPKHAYLIVRMSENPVLMTKTASNGNGIVELDGATVGLIPTDEPVVINGDKFSIKFTTTDFHEAFLPWVIEERGDYVDGLVMWFKDKKTKDAKMREMASLWLSAFPELSYKKN